MEEGREFVQKIPGYQIKDEDEYFNLHDFPDYIEINYKGNIYPVTRFMFKGNTQVDILWQKLPNFSKQGSGIVSGLTSVDAYIIDSSEVKDYINKREEKYLRVKALLEKNNIEVERDFFGSEDGEAIVYKHHYEDEWHFLIHMDPIFTEEENIEELVERNLKG